MDIKHDCRDLANQDLTQIIDTLDELIQNYYVSHDNTVSKVESARDLIARARKILKFAQN